MREGILGPPLEFVNADLHERAHLQHITSGEERSRAARTWADGRRATLLATRTPFATETVFSHPTKLDLIANAQRQGFISGTGRGRAGRSAAPVGARGAARARRRPPVPPERILARYPRTMALLAQAVRQADVAYLYDAAEVRAGGPQLVAVRSAGNSTPVVAPLPAWAQAMLGAQRQ